MKKNNSKKMLFIAGMMIISAVAYGKDVFANYGTNFGKVRLSKLSSPNMEDVKKINKNMPIIFLTARNMKEDILKGYQLGADDYITKPFDTELLLYKIKAILQRSVVIEEEEQEHFEISNIIFDSVLRQLRVNDKEYKLSPKENELLKMLCLHRTDFMPRDLALRKIWKKENYFTARSMDVYIAKLRKILKDDDGLEIINVHGEGFRLLIKN